MGTVDLFDDYLPNRCGGLLQVSQGFGNNFGLLTPVGIAWRGHVPFYLDWDFDFVVFRKLQLFI